MLPLTFSTSFEEIHYAEAEPVSNITLIPSVAKRDPDWDGMVREVIDPELVKMP
jgi:hypothetical protein